MGARINITVKARTVLVPYVKYNTMKKKHIGLIMCWVSTYFCLFICTFLFVLPHHRKVPNFRDSETPLVHISYTTAARGIESRETFDHVLPVNTLLKNVVRVGKSQGWTLTKVLVQ